MDNRSYIYRNHHMVHKAAEADHTEQPPNRYPIFILIGLIIVMAIISVMLIMSIRKVTDDTATQQESTVVDAVEKVTPTPKPIPTGPMTMTVMSGKKTGPLFRSFTVDPYDPPLGSTMKIGITLRSEYPVTSVVADVRTDNKSTNIPLSFTGEDNGILSYEGKWVVDDTYLYTYQVQLMAVDSQGEEAVVTPTLR